MDRRHTPSRPVIMYDQIMASDDPVIALHKLADPVIFLRCYRLSDQRLQRIPGNPDPGPHNDQRHCKSDDPVHIPSGKMKNQKGGDGRRCGHHIAHSVRGRSQHHLGVDPFPQLPVKKSKPQLHSDRQDQDYH